ncbi:MAG: helix-turn-helix transcriptional regulator [Chloroflexi bacterium]|nr:helix-turn-helix transcriptional regulator [Chloroflexota bacterium]
MSDSNTAPYKPIPEYVVNDLDTLRVLADPLRIQIIELVTHEPRTVKQVAAVLELPPTKLYYHIKLLEEHGLIRVVDTRIVSGIVEKQYQATALSYHVNKGLFSPASPSGLEGLDMMLRGLFDDTRADIEESVAGGAIDVHAGEDGDGPVNRMLLIARNTLHLLPEQADDFYRRLRALIREFVGEDERLSGSPDEQTYGLLVTLYPSTRQSSPGRSGPADAE